MGQLNGRLLSMRIVLTASVCVLLLTGCGAVKSTFDVVGGAGKLTFGAAKGAVDLAQGGVRIAQGGIEVAKGAADLGTHAGRSTLEIAQKGFETAGSAVRLVDQIGEASHRGQMRDIATTTARAQARSALR